MEKAKIKTFGLHPADLENLQKIKERLGVHAEVEAVRHALKTAAGPEARK